MAYLLDLFTPETWHSFRQSGERVTGFRQRHRRLAGERVNQGDIFLCYLTRLSRWCGVLQVQSEVYEDDSPVFDDPDPFTVRFKVKPIVVLDHESAVPIYEDEVWSTLSVTNRYHRGQSHWTGFFRGSLNRFSDSDGSYLTDLLKDQAANPRSYPLTDKDRRQLAPILDGEVEDENPEDIRESILMQAKVAEIGAAMGFQIWVPKSDKARVLESIPADMHHEFLDALPLNYDDRTLRTIEQIDVLWLKDRSMARAFEIEHTTATYSGLLRMADLLALQPNMDIRLHIVAPDERRERVLREINRPVFSRLARGPLYDQCSFLGYRAVDSLAGTRHLSHMSDTIIDEYDETAQV